MKLIMAVLVLAGVCLAQQDSIVTNKLNSKGNVEAPNVEKRWKKCPPIFRYDTLIFKPELHRKDGTVITNIGKFVFIKTERSDIGYTTVLDNSGFTFREIECDTCTKR